MTPLRTRILLLPLLTAAALLQACGQVGPLYQPPPEATEQSGATDSGGG